MDEMNGRRRSSSSSSDFYTADAPDPQSPRALASTTLSPMEKDEPVAAANDPHDDADDEDSSSEMDVSASSRPSSAEPVQIPPAQHAGTKRKLSDPAHMEDASTPVAADDMAKKRKLAAAPPPAQDPPGSPPRHAGLPVEIWQHIFLYLPPAMLCRCLRVSRVFNDLLTKTKPGPVAKKGQPRVRMQDSEAIWTHARKLFFPNLPRPLVRFMEWEMLQLIAGRTCQFCNRDPVPSPATTPFNCGPGPDGFRVIWPFGIRACGHCIENNSLKDVQILVSHASTLRSGLPHIYLTPDLNFVPEIQRQAPGGIPSHLRVAKVYYKQDIETIVTEFESAKSFGDGAAEEWRKGLPMKGKEAMADAARWEKWEAQMRLGSDLAQVLREYDLSSFPNHLEEVHRRSTGSIATQPAVVSNGTHLLPQPVQAFPDGYAPPFPVPGVQYQQAQKPAKGLHEVEAARQSRKAEIERRCLELEPPLDANVLQHIESFQAAMQISQPMTDAAWDFLRPKILAQREAAELIEHQRQEQWAALQATVPSTAAEEAFIKPAKELYDKDYEHAQEPLRKKLGEYADEYIGLHWSGAHALDKDNCPSFAVETMLYVRQKYLLDKETGALPSFDVPVRAGSKQGTPIPEPFLSLDNMKWVYDNKIRTLTDNHRRELFICAGCAEERKPKWFAFEGLIQHYGAKHTTAFSKGNIVVHWQTSEWPDDPPFHLNPSAFIKADRRASDFKNHGRARNTPQANHDSAFAPPGSGKLLSENPFFSSHASPPSQATNGYYHPSAGYQPYPYGHGSPPMAPYGHAYSAAHSGDPTMDRSVHAQVNKLSSDAREIWDGLDGVKELLECVRIQAVVHHVVTRFENRFGWKPNLDLVTDALATGGDLIKPIKNAQGLACKACVAAQTDGSANYQSYFARIRNVRLFNASSLITHFKILHQEQKLDWTEEMIELPETQIISDLLRAPGMDDDKLAILASTFPTAFPWPLPKIGVVQEPQQDVGPDSGLANRLLNRLNKKPKQQHVKKKGHYAANGSSTPGRETSQEPLPEANEDEYDPRRPLYLVSPEQNADPARFDTDIARQASSAASPTTSNTLNLAPETLAALNNLNALALNQNGQGDARGDRSPSVGRAESLSSIGHPTESTPKVQPDISAILASLTGQPQQPSHNATPPTTVSNRSDSAPKHLTVDPYGQPLDFARRNYQDDKRSASHYAAQPAAYQSSLEPATRFDAQDVHHHPASSSRNIETFDHNRARSYVDASSSYPPQHSPPRSPPRYRYIYDDGGGGQRYPPQQQPVQHAPVYREQHVQYIQLPPEHLDRPRGPPVTTTTSYQYERPPVTRPMFVDEYGRPVEVIPIDSAPAPVQYIPHPYEQQQQQQFYAHHQQPVPVPASRPHHLGGHQQQVFYEFAGPAAPPPPPPTSSGHGAAAAQGMY